MVSDRTLRRHREKEARKKGGELLGDHQLPPGKVQALSNLEKEMELLTSNEKAIIEIKLTCPLIMGLLEMADEEDTTPLLLIEEMIVDKYQEMSLCP